MKNIRKRLCGTLYGLIAMIASVAMVYAIELRETTYYQQSQEYYAMATNAYEIGDYDAAKEYAEQYKDYAKRAKAYVVYVQEGEILAEDAKVERDLAIEGGFHTNEISRVIFETATNHLGEGLYLLRLATNENDLSMARIDTVFPPALELLSNALTYGRMSQGVSEQYISMKEKAAEWRTRADEEIQRGRRVGADINPFSVVPFSNAVIYYNSGETNFTNTLNIEDPDDLNTFNFIIEQYSNAITHSRNAMKIVMLDDSVKGWKLKASDMLVKAEAIGAEAEVAAVDAYASAKRHFDSGAYIYDTTINGIRMAYSPGAGVLVAATTPAIIQQYADTIARYEAALEDYKTSYGYANTAFNRVKRLNELDCMLEHYQTNAENSIAEAKRVKADEDDLTKTFYSFAVRSYDEGTNGLSNMATRVYNNPASDTEYADKVGDAQDTVFFFSNAYNYARYSVETIQLKKDVKTWKAKAEREITSAERQKVDTNHLAQPRFEAAKEYFDTSTVAIKASCSVIDPLEIVNNHRSAFEGYSNAYEEAHKAIDIQRKSVPLFRLLAQARDGRADLIKKNKLEEGSEDDALITGNIDEGESFLNELEFDKSRERLQEALRLIRILPLKREAYRRLNEAMDKVNEVYEKGLGDKFTYSYNEACRFFELAKEAYCNEEYSKTLCYVNQILSIITNMYRGIPYEKDTSVDPCGTPDSDECTTKDGGNCGQFPKYYRVQDGKGECLWKIASYSFIYGNPEYWKIIYKANKKLLKNRAINRPIDLKGENLLLPGDVLYIPSIKGEKRSGTYDPKAKYGNFKDIK